MKNIKIKKLKCTSKKIQQLDNRLMLEKYHELSIILKNTKEFLYDFIYLYDNLKIKDNMYPCIDKKCYKFIYEDEIVTKLQKNKTTVSKKINILTTLGLLEKLNIYDNKYKHLNINNAIEKAKKNNNKTVIFFYIPNYTFSLLNSANEKAAKMLKNNFTIKKFNKNFVINVFGQEIANDIFLDKRKIPNLYFKQLENIKNILVEHLNTNNILSLNEFKNIVYKEYKIYNINHFNAINNNIDDVLNILLKNNEIQKRRLIQKEKELYNINTRNYKYFILKGENWNYE